MLPLIIINTLYRLRKQRRFLKKHVEKEVRSFRDRVLLNDLDEYKIFRYYGLGVPAVLGESFCMLQGRKMSFEERKAITHLGVITGLMDDLFDKGDGNHKHLHDLIKDPFNYDSIGTKESMVVHFYGEALHQTHNKTQLIHAAIRVLEAQVNSQKQRLNTIGLESLKEITYAKGAASILFYSSIFVAQLTPEEKALFECMGSFMQLGNDIFDVYDDTKDGINTLVNTGVSIGQVRIWYHELVKDMMRLAHQTHYETKHIDAFLRFIYLGSCRVYVCLDMLEQLEKENYGVFDPKLYGREDLICDMEQPKNFVQSIRYYLRYKKLI